MVWRKSSWWELAHLASGINLSLFDLNCPYKSLMPPTNYNMPRWTNLKPRNVPVPSDTIWLSRNPYSKLLSVQKSQAHLSSHWPDIRAGRFDHLHGVSIPSQSSVTNLY